jgi:negative regulator of flagellin synthesis FlgM
VKIDDSIKKSAGLAVGPTQTRTGKGADKAGSVAKSSTSGSASVHISSQSQSLSQVGGEGTFDSNKVAEIKAAIASGQFQVNPEKVANGLIDTVKDLLHSRTA